MCDLYACPTRRGMLNPLSSWVFISKTHESWWNNNERLTILASYGTTPMVLNLYVFLVGINGKQFLTCHNASAYSTVSLLYTPFTPSFTSRGRRTVVPTAITVFSACPARPQTQQASTKIPLELTSASTMTSSECPASSKQAASIRRDRARRLWRARQEHREICCRLVG